MSAINIVCGGGERFDSTDSGNAYYEPLYGQLDDDGVEGEAEYTCRTSYTLDNLVTFVSENSTNAAHTLRSRKNQTNGAMSVSITALTTGIFEDTLNSDSLVDTDESNSQIALGTIGHSEFVNFQNIGYVLDDASADEYPLCAATHINNATFFVQNTTREFPIAGSIEAQITTEAEAQYTVRQAITLDNAQVWVQANSVDTDSTLSVRVNGADGNLTISITGDTTGRFEDTTGSDSLSNGDAINWQIVLASSAMAGDNMDFQIASVSADGEVFITMASEENSGNSGDIEFTAVCGKLLTQSTESDKQHKIRTEVVAQNGFTRLSANDLDAATTMILRADGADTSMVISMTASTTGAFEDTVNTPTLSDQELINWELDTLAASSGSFVQTLVAFEQQEPGGGGPPPTRRTTFATMLPGRHR